MRLIKKREPAWIIPSASRLPPSQPPIPSPLDYLPRYQMQSHLKRPKVAVISQAETKHHTTTSPGPADYSVAHKQKGASAILIGKPNSRHKDVTPGPGHYQYKYDTVDGRGPRLGSPREKQEEQKSPVGPGAYQAFVPKANPITMPKSRRPSLERGGQAPGPGSYFTQVKRSKSSAVFTRSQRRLSIASKTPAPGEYNIDSEFDKNVRQKRGFSLISKKETSVCSPSPGPAKYAHPPSYHILGSVISSAPKMTVTEQEAAMLSQIPSPFQYNVGLQLKKGIKIPQSKREIVNSSINPGPGHYKIQTSFKTLQKKRAFSFGKMNKLSSANENTPGPADYLPQTNLVLPKSARVVMGIRDNCNSKQQTPGPGHYISQPGQRRSSKGVSIGLKLREKDRQRTPGPGDYNIGCTIGV